jgi:hypothetical protein
VINAFAFIKVREHSKTFFEWRRTHLLFFLSIFIKKQKIVNHNYYGAIRYWAEFDDKDVSSIIINKLIRLLNMMIPDDFPCIKPEKIFI